MKKYVAHNLYDAPGGRCVLPLRDVYLASEVDARIAELEKALREVRDLAQPEARMRVANKFLMEVKP